jgi:hypothetical protein
MYKGGNLFMTDFSGILFALSIAAAIVLTIIF